MEEYIDVLDQEGKHIGKTKLKSQVHKDGDWHAGSHVWVINSQNELLIQKRAHNKDCYPNMWDISSAGGHAIAGEQYLEAAIREVGEELGLKLKKENLKYLFSVICHHITNNGAFIDHEFNYVYLTKLDLDIKKINIQKEELSKVKWIYFEKLEKLINEKNKNFVSYDEEYKKLFSFLRNEYIKN